MRLRLRRPKTARRWHKQIIRHVIRRVCGKNATITGMPGPKPFIRSKPTDDDVRVLLALYAAERSDSAYLTQAGRAIIAALLVYVGSVAALGQNFQDAPLLTLIVPLPALGLLIVFVVNSFNQALRDVSSRSLETLLHGATSGYLPNWTIDMLAKSAQGLEEGMPALLPDEAKALDPKHFRDSQCAASRDRDRADCNRPFLQPPSSQQTSQMVFTNLQRPHRLSGGDWHGPRLVLRPPPGHLGAQGYNVALGTVDDYVPRGRRLYRASGHVVLGGFAGIRHRKRAEIAAKILLDRFQSARAPHSSPRPSESHSACGPPLRVVPYSSCQATHELKH